MTNIVEVNKLLGINLYDAPSFRADVRIDFDEFGNVISATLLNSADNIDIDEIIAYVPEVPEAAVVITLSDTIYTIPLDVFLEFMLSERRKKKIMSSNLRQTAQNFQKQQIDPRYFQRPRRYVQNMRQIPRRIARRS
jgi:hypothetical protein